MIRAVVALAALWPLAAYAHDKWADGSPVPSWVKAACCGEADAHHLRPDQVHREDDDKGGHYRVDGYPYPIPAEKALPSQDGGYWIFYRPAGPSCSIETGKCSDMPPSAVFCFFIPMGA